MHRILVIANRTCPCPALQDLVAERAAYHGEHEVLLVAPALNSRLAHLMSDTDAAVAAARERVEGAVARLSERGLRVRGQVGDAEPLTAIEDALAVFAADEVMIATHPPGHSHWLERGLVVKAQARLSVPVRHVVSEYALAEVA
jgi:hypothetical protein